MKILVIQQKMIGDVLVSSLICENLKLNYPKAEIHYLVNRFTIPVIENNPYIDEIVVFEDTYRSSKLKFYHFLKRIKKAKYDMVIDAYGKLESNLITLFSGAKTKISWEKTYSRFIYSDVFKNKIRSTTNAGLAIEDRLKLLKPLNLKTPLKDSPKIYLTEVEIAEAKAKLNHLGIDFLKPIFMIGVLGSNSSKSYPSNYMAEVLDHIVEVAKGQLIFNFAPHQKEEALELYHFCEKSTQNKIYLELTPTLLREFMALTYHCDALIGNEGGAINMAKALGTPTFTIYSPWIDKKAWGSFEDDKKHTSIHLEEVKPEYYKNNSYKDLRAKSKLLYTEFKTDFVLKKLTPFITQIIA